MAHADLIPLVEALSTARVLCVGDVMLDRYIYGRVERISPEAPVPVLCIEREEVRLGGAGNVLRNLHALGAQTSFVSVTGGDREGRDIVSMVAELGGAEAHVLTERNRVTTVKTRFIADTQQLLRADRERGGALSPDLRGDLLQIVRDTLPHHQVTIVSDYAKGVLADGVAAEIIDAARAADRIVIVDPKSRDYAVYRGASVIKPNRHELAQAAKRPVDEPAQIVSAALALIEAHEFGAMLVSCGKDGMMLVEASGATYQFDAEAREVYDVSGAGDTALAALVLALAAGTSLEQAAHFANAAAGVAVGKLGTAAVTPGELLAYADAAE